MGSIGGGGDEPVQWAGGGGGERILVSVRARPLNDKELDRRDVSDWECINNTTIIFKGSMPQQSILPGAYSYDRVFGCECATRQVYEEGAKEVALSVVGGIHSSIFAYGQTSSGKTYTMTGITEYSVADIYDYIHKHSEREFVLKFSAMEIYNESVKDLLSTDNTPLRLLDDPEKGTTVERLTEETLRDQSHLRALLSFCEAQRQIGETSLNEMSSRSHQILRLTIESSAREYSGKDSRSTLSATVNFVDLAGSERASQALTAGTRLKEGCHINRSLLTLGTVIRKLSKGRNGHIPYRDSKLTRILQHSLGGNARTAIICTMSPARSHIEQTRNTLLFASCAKEVSTNARVNVVMSDKALVKHLQRELARLENELKYPGVVSPSDALREREIRIKKMEKEMKELMQQRDLAQSRLEDLLRVVGEDQPSRQWEEVNRFSLHHESIACEDMSSISETSGVAYQLPEFDYSSFESLHDSYSRNEYHLQLSDLSKEQHADEISSPRSVVLLEHHEQAEIDQIKSEDPDHCKEVRCIEVDESPPSRSDKFAHLLIDDSDSLLLPSVDGNDEADGETKPKGNSLPQIFYDNDGGDQEPKSKGTSLPQILDDHNEADQELKSIVTLPNLTIDIDSVEDHEPTYKETPQLPSALDDNMHVVHEPGTDGHIAHPTLDNDKHEDNKPEIERNTDVKLPLEKAHSCMTINSPLKPYEHELSPWSSQIDLPNSRSLVFTRSRSCRGSLMASPSSLWFHDFEKNSYTPCNGSMKDLAMPEGVRRRLSAVNHGADTEPCMIDRYDSPEKSTESNLLKEQNSRTSSEEGISSHSSFVGLNEMEQIQYEKQRTDGQELEVSEGCTVERTMKDVRMDPMQHPWESPSPWPLEFERKQKDIIELWHACHVSLVHRTCFFQLFKGDPADSIYMEVEHRRLSFLRTSSSLGSLDKIAMGDSSNTTLASSMKELRRERDMLRKQMLKKLSTQERESYYTEWGIALDSKQRRQQLARRIWTETNIEHVRESASLVAKLIGLLEPGHALKEMFGLNFTPYLTNFKSYSRKNRGSSFM